MVAGEDEEASGARSTFARRLDHLQAAHVVDAGRVFDQGVEVGTVRLAPEVPAFPVRTAGERVQEDGEGRLRTAKPPAMKLRVNKSGGVTGVVGEARFAAHEKGAKLRMGDQWVAITREGIFFSSPPTLAGQDPIPNDDG